MYSHCPTEPPTLPSASSFPPVEGQQVRPNLSIYSPLNGDVIYDTDIAIVASTYTEKDSTSVRLEGGEICIGYTVSLPPSSGSAVISSFHSCLTATGPFTELTIPGSKEQMVVVTLEMELKEGKEGQGGGTAVTQFHMGPREECDQPSPFDPGIIIPDSEIALNTQAFTEIPILLVMAHWKEDLSWIASNPFPAVVYHKHPDDSNDAPHFVPHNVAGEASAYLKFIVDYYDSLPESVIMLHSHRYAYHQEDVLILLENMKRKERSWKEEYCNINSAVWGFKEDPEREWMRVQWEGWMGDWLGEDFPPGEDKTFPHPILERCCAQFVVGRERIRRRSKEFYERALEVMYSAKDKEESRKMGLLMEWVWHMIFGEPQIIDRDEVKNLLPSLMDFEQASLRQRNWCVER